MTPSWARHAASDARARRGNPEQSSARTRSACRASRSHSLAPPLHYSRSAQLRLSLGNLHPRFCRSELRQMRFCSVSRLRSVTKTFTTTDRSFRVRARRLARETTEPRRQLRKSRVSRVTGPWANSSVNLVTRDPAWTHFHLRYSGESPAAYTAALARAFAPRCDLHGLVAAATWALASCVMMRRRAAPRRRRSPACGRLLACAMRRPSPHRGSQRANQG